MSAEPPHKWLAQWQEGELTVERAVGQLLVGGKAGFSLKLWARF
jgi:hypothetical protein